MNNQSIKNSSNLLFLFAICLTPLFYAAINYTNNDLNKDYFKEKKQISSLLDAFNEAAARADYEGYFRCFSEDATFLGTDATEHWDKKSFMIWAKPYFDRKKAWSFTSLDRHIYFGKYPDIAWFDELLNTQMKICRGSGVIVKQNKEWKIQQYVLSMTIPNSQTNPVIAIKTPVEDSLITTLLRK